MALQGPHQSAKKSMTTYLVESIRVLKSASELRTAAACVVAILRDWLKEDAQESSGSILVNDKAGGCFSCCRSEEILKAGRLGLGVGIGAVK